jgi:long-chain acyl-CoA synthetase
MGAGQGKEILYSVPITAPGKNETAIYRNPSFKDALLTTPKSGARTVQEILFTNFKQLPDKEFIGHREITGYHPDPKTKKNLPILKPEFKFLTFSQVKELTSALGAGMIELELTAKKSQFKDYTIEFVGIHSKNTLEWTLVDLANISYGFTTLPLYDTLGEDAVDFMLEETEVSTLFVSVELLGQHIKRLKSGKFSHLKQLVIMDENALTDENIKALEGTKWYKFSQVIGAGKISPKSYPTVKPSDIAFFSYTSGTTGAPKGAMLSHGNLVSLVAGIESSLTMINKDTVYLSYLPLAHVFEKCIFTQLTYLGANYGIFGGDVLKLKDDLAILKPTAFVSVPRLFNKFYDVIRGKMSELTGCKASLSKKALSTKLANIDKGQYSHFIYDKLVFNKMKQVLGGRVEILLSGSAPLAVPVRKYLKACFAAPFLEGYGQTEGIGAEFVTHPDDPRVDTVGGPIPMNEFKLIDVPEMNYFSTDKDEHGRLAPRGEILVRGANIIPGYYKAEDKTAETIDADGWLHSGDIGTIIPGTNALKITDRRKNIFKLSQGEYVAPDRLEQVFKTCLGIQDIYIYGDSLKSYLVGIVNLAPAAALKIAESKGIQASDVAELVSNDQFNKVLLENLKKCADENGLKGFERIARIFIDVTPFHDHGLITTTFKLKRNEAKEYYKSQIAKLYEGLD